MLMLSFVYLRAESGNPVVQQGKKNVTVVVSDEFGAVAGANVLVKGTTNGNITDPLST